MAERGHGEHVRASGSLRTQHKLYLSHLVAAKITIERVCTSISDPLYMQDLTNYNTGFLLFIEGIK